jgi:sporulation protein YlmC with PRC-barrel domain
MIRTMFLTAALLAGAGTAALAEEDRQGAGERTQAAPADRMGAIPPAGDRHPEYDAGTSTAAPRADERAEAREHAEAADPGARPTHAAQAKVIERKTEGQVRADDLLGSTVRNPQGEALGKVSDLLLERDGRVAGLVLDTDGFVDGAAGQVALSWEAVDLGIGEDGEPVAEVDLDAASLREAAPFERRSD